MTSAATQSRLTSARAGVSESFATDTEERTLDIVLGDNIANQQFKVRRVSIFHGNAVRLSGALDSTTADTTIFGGGGDHQIGITVSAIGDWDDDGVTLQASDGREHS